MTGNIKVNWKRLILAMVISIGAGVISWLLTGNSMEIYRDLNKPALSPPGQLFPIVWTILFILMDWHLILYVRQGMMTEQKH